MFFNERQDQYWLMKDKINVGQVWVQVLGLGPVVLGRVKTCHKNWPGGSKGVKTSVVRILKMLLVIWSGPDPGTK